MSAEPSSFRYAFAQSPCGGLELELAGVQALLRPSGAMWLAAERLLVVADLHLEKGSAYAARGQMLPPYDTRETLARLAAEAAQLRPRTILLLGDTLHDRAAEGRLSAEDARTLTTIAAVSELVWVIGNHDADGPGALPGAVAPGWSVAGLSLVHEPAAAPRYGEVAGHLHPAAKVKGRVGSMRRRCFVTDGERLVLPAFGAYAGGLNIRDAAFHGLFRRPPLAVALGERRAHAVGWEQLRAD
ncbi:MAG TPA: ligase-associated DNA damage response endonuclease PdeM [Caulobacteraceae bacterium]|nr:ligase-associated DNA damage response endonuclease PdeM [Caulobacteraceae bacterium]